MPSRPRALILLLFLIAGFESRAHEQTRCIQKFLFPVYRVTAECGADARPTDRPYNEFGFRETEPPGRSPGELVILLLGGADLDEEQLPDDQSYARVMQEELKRLTAKKIRVVNSVFWNYGAMDSLTVLYRAIEVYKPDLVLYRLGGADNIFTTAALGRIIPRKSLRPVTFGIPAQSAFARFARITSVENARSVIISAGMFPILWRWIAGDRRSVEKTMAPVLDVLTDMQTISESRRARFAVLWNGEPIAFKPWSARGPLRYLFWAHQIFSPLKQKVVLRPSEVSLTFAEKNLPLVTNARVANASKVQRDLGEEPGAAARLKQEVVLLAPSLVGLAM